VNPRVLRDGFVDADLRLKEVIDDINQ
jgi:hypothetical protein